MKDFLESIQSLFVDVLLVPYDFFRFTESWWSANIINWIFMIICFVAMVYWIIQLKIFDNKGEENKDISAHSYI